MELSFLTNSGDVKQCLSLGMYFWCKMQGCFALECGLMPVVMVYRVRGGVVVLVLLLIWRRGLGVFGRSGRGRAKLVERCWMLHF